MANKFPFELWNRDIILKRGGQSGKPSERPMNVLLNYGIVNIDKPAGPTSHMVTAYVKEILGIPKCGHSGTLDPRVTGVLPIALNHASRIVQALLPAGKEYVALMHVHQAVPEERLREVIDEFIGKITQMPPVKSAVKREKRQRIVYYINVLEINGKDVLFRVGCQAGTYIRKLCFDIGKRLGTGAHMAELRRTRVATFDESTAVSLYELKDAFHYYKKGNEKFLRSILQPVEKGVEHLSKIWVVDTAVESLSHGRDLGMPGVAKFESCIEPGQLVAIMSLNNELVALGVSNMESDELLKLGSGIAAFIHKVFIQHSR